MMKNDTRYISALDDSLKIFFRDAVKKTVTRPSHAWHFLKTVRWQKQAQARRAVHAAEGLHVPPIMIFSITHQCNLNCKGCYAKALDRSAKDELSDQDLARIIGEAHDLGTSFFVIAGGEPLVRKNLMEIVETYPDMLFLVFTNGLLIDEPMLKRLKRTRNFVPVVSLEGPEADTDLRRGEGVFARLDKTVDNLHQNGIFFSVSVTVSRLNLDVVMGDKFVPNLAARGCRLFFFLEYTPIREGTEGWMPTEEERERLNLTVERFRKEHPALFISVPGDEEAFGGCLSAGRGFLHIAANGDVEPCPFAPFSDINVREMSLKEALKSRLLSVIRENADRLEEGPGGCTLWQQREWVQSLLEAPVDSSE